MRNKSVSIAGKDIRVEERRIGELERLIAELFPSSKGKLANIDLAKEFGDIDFAILYKKLPVIFPEFTRDDVANAFMSEIEMLLEVFIDVNFFGLKRVLKPMIALAQSGLPQK